MAKASILGQIHTIFGKLDRKAVELRYQSQPRRQKYVLCRNQCQMTLDDSETFIKQPTECIYTGKVLAVPRKKRVPRALSLCFCTRSPKVNRCVMELPLQNLLEVVCFWVCDAEGANCVVVLFSHIVSDVLVVVLSCT